MSLSVQSVHKSYTSAAGRTDILRGVSMTLEKGDTLALMGESGSGKSTLLHLIGGLDVPDSGTISLDSDTISVASDTHRAELRRTRIGIIFQHFNLIPSLTVDANIAFQARLANRHDPEWCRSLADTMGLSDHLTKFPEALSGGQQQRVAIARALAARPDILLADEPTGNLDEATAETVLDLLVSLTRQTNTSLLMVTHSARHAKALNRQMTLRSGVVAS